MVFVGSIWNNKSGWYPIGMSLGLSVATEIVLTSGGPSLIFNPSFAQNQPRTTPQIQWNSSLPIQWCLLDPYGRIRVAGSRLVCPWGCQWPQKLCWLLWSITDFQPKFCSKSTLLVLFCRIDLLSSTISRDEAWMTSIFQNINHRSLMSPSTSWSQYCHCGWVRRTSVVTVVYSAHNFLYSLDLLFDWISLEHDPLYPLFSWLTSLQPPKLSFSCACLLVLRAHQQSRFPWCDVVSTNGKGGVDRACVIRVVISFQCYFSGRIVDDVGICLKTKKLWIAIILDTNCTYIRTSCV
jgi:hypothetical protein